MADEPQKTQDENTAENEATQAAPEKSIEAVATEYFNNWRRALADYDNLKKSVAQEKAEMGKFASAMAAYEFVNIYDNFKKAAAHLPEAGENLEDYKKRVEQWVTGIDFIKKQFGETLKQLGLEEIKTVGEKFDPAWHEAVGEEDGGQTGVISKEVEGGYKMGDKVMKAAKVIVGK